MGTIIAIGGGELRYLETFEIDQQIVKLTGVDHPKALFIPTASHESERYIQCFEIIYGEKLGCEVETLYLLSQQLDQQQIRHQILSADLIYVGGGDTEFMMQTWATYGVDNYLKEAYEKGVVLAGLSAGAICWAESGYSDSDSFKTEEEWEYKFVKGLGLINASLCPHYDEKGRERFDEAIRDQQGIGIALENNVAYVIQGQKVSIIKSDSNKKAYQVMENTKIELT